MSQAFTAEIPIGRIDYHQDNYNDHPAEQIALIQDSIQDHGYIRRIVVHAQPGGRYKVVAGEGVLRALKQLHYSTLEATVIPEEVTEDEALSYLIDDNELAKKSRPDRSKLLALLERLKGTPQEPSGVTPEQLDLLRQNAAQGGPKEPLSANGSAQPKDNRPDLTDRSGELVEKWGVEAGQLWKLGDHLLICEDATNPESWDRLMDAAGIRRVQGIFTSPPYADQRMERYGGTAPEDFVVWWMEGIDPLVQIRLDQAGSFFLNIQAATKDGRRLTYDKKLVLELEVVGWIYFDEYSWIKPGRPGEYRKRFKNAREPIHQFVTDPELLEDNIEEVFEERRSEVKASWKGLEQTQGYKANRKPGEERYVEVVRPSNVLKIGHDQTGIPQDNHPARFPVRLPSFFIRAYSKPGQWWLDPFAGTFTTGVAADNHGRLALGIDNKPNYVAIALERFAVNLGIKGELINDLG